MPLPEPTTPAEALAEEMSETLQAMCEWSDSDRPCDDLTKPARVCVTCRASELIESQSREIERLREAALGYISIVRSECGDGELARYAALVDLRTALERSAQ